MYEIQNLCILPTECICLVHINLTLNSYYFALQHLWTGFLIEAYSVLCEVQTESLCITFVFSLKGVNYVEM